jgi:proline iminopeptidase
MSRGRVPKLLAAAAGLLAGAALLRGLVQGGNRAKAYLPEGVDDKSWVLLGGLEQWVTIRGRNPENPVLLVLHGGPGAPLSLLAHKAFDGWDEAFTVVNWDQRGAGRTFARHGAAGCGPLSIERMAEDGIDLAEALRQRFPGRPLIVLGISWGSILGVEMIRRRPDLFAAYVGAGQAVDMPRGETLSYFGALDRLRERGRTRDAAALQAIPPPPYASLKAVQTQRKLLISTMPEAERRMFRTMVVELLLAPDSRLSDLPAFLRGAKFSTQALWAEFMNWRLADGGRTFGMPMIFLQGELDLQTPTALVSEVTPQLTSPHTELILFTEAGHLAMVTHRDEFLREMIERVRPLALAPAAAKKTRARNSTGSSRPNGRLGA